VILNAGGGRDYQDKGQTGWSLQDDFTWYGWDKHTIKAGAKFKSVEINAFEQQPFNPQFFYDIGESLVTPYKVQFGANTIPGIDRNISSRNRQFGIYFQDDWEVNDKLLLNLGVRWDYEVSPGYLDYETPANLVAALRGWSNVHGPNVDYDIEDYISDGGNRDAFTGAFQPRLGFSYDLNADQRHVIFGGAGRAYDRNLWDYLALEQSKSTFPQYEFNFQTPDHPCTVGTNNCLAWNPAVLRHGQPRALVAANPNWRRGQPDEQRPGHAYSDQFSIGMRNVFNDVHVEWNSSVTLLHVVSHDGLVFSLGNRSRMASFRDPEMRQCDLGLPALGLPDSRLRHLHQGRHGIETKLDSRADLAGEALLRGFGWA
jgi:hypothetical protein